MELVMFVGIPASGKSTHSAFYRDQGYLVLSSDEIRNEITGGVDQESLSEKERSRLHSQVFEIIRRQAVGALKQGRSVVVDATNLSRKRRMNSSGERISGSFVVYPPRWCTLHSITTEVLLQDRMRSSVTAERLVYCAIY